MLQSGQVFGILEDLGAEEALCLARGRHQGAVQWFREAFLAATGKRLDEQRAALAFRAIDDALAASFGDHNPRPRRVHDAAPYTFAYNATIAALNLRLRERICAYETGNPRKFARK